MDDGRLSVLPSLARPNFISVCHCLRGFGEMVVLFFGFVVQGMVVADCFYNELLVMVASLGSGLDVCCYSTANSRLFHQEKTEIAIWEWRIAELPGLSVSFFFVFVDAFFVVFSSSKHPHLWSLCGLIESRVQFLLHDRFDMIDPSILPKTLWNWARFRMPWGWQSQVLGDLLFRHQIRWC